MSYTHRIRRMAVSTLALAIAGAAHAQSAPLHLNVYHGDANSFYVSATVVSGDTEALVIDSGFTRADALRVAANVLDSGKTLKTILVSNADPDYYFGVEVLKAQFPQAQVVATPAVLARIQSLLDRKLAFWPPKMGANAPQHPVLPVAMQGTTLTVDGQTVEVRGTTGPLAYRPYVWIPSIRTVAGNIAVFGNLHVWTADTQTPALRDAWRRQLDEIEALKPTTVVPGHMLPGTAMDVGTIRYTREYLLRFERELAKTRHSADLIATMKQAYPDAGLDIALQIGAKVGTGEMTW